MRCEPQFLLQRPSVVGLQMISSASRGCLSSAVGEFSTEHVNRLAALKIKDMAEEAERLARGTGWLPPLMRRPLRQHADENGKPSSAADDASDGICEHADDDDVPVADDGLGGEHEAEREAARDWQSTQPTGPRQSKRLTFKPSGL